MLITFGKGYGEAWPGGPWIHSGILPSGLPNGKALLYFRVSEDARIAGQTGPENHAHYWDGTTWHDLGLAPGANVAAFHPTNGNVYVSGPDGIKVFNRAGTEDKDAFIPGYAGSQGIRWIDPDGTVHTGDATYSGPPLWEWTQVGDLRIGQGGPNAPDEGVRVVGPDGVLRAVNRDVARFIRCNAVGDQIAICYLRTTDGVNVRIQTTHSELLAQPPVVASQPPPVQPPPPKEPPVPLTLIAPNEKAAVAAAIAAHPEINTKDENARGRVIDYVCADLNPPGTTRPWGRKGKDAAGKNLNTDGLTFLRPDGLFEIYDVIGGNSGAASWTGYGPFKQGENGYWVPALPVDVVDPPADPPPSPAPPSDADLSARVVALEAALARALDAIEQLEGTRATVQQVNDCLHSSILPALAKKGDPVAVRGTIGFGAVLSGGKVTWTDGVIGGADDLVKQP